MYRIAIVIAALAGPVLADDPAQPPAQTGEVTVDQRPPDIVIPECNDYRLQNDSPLLPRQRACIWRGNLFSAGAIFGATLSAAYGQVTKDDPSFGQGTAGYARRFGGRYAGGATKATAEYLTAWAFGEDTRQKPSQCSSVGKRILCAAKSMIMQPKESGGERPVFSKFAGAFASGFIGMAYYPESGTVNVSLRRSGTSLATSLLSIEFAEFSPDLLRWVGKKFSPKSTAKQAAGVSSPKR